MNIELRKPYPKQREIIDDPHRFKVICAGRRVGKSTLCLTAIIEAFLKGERVAYIMPTWSDCEAYFDDYIYPVFSNNTTIPQLRINQSRLLVEFTHGDFHSKIQFFTGEKLDRLRSKEFDLMIVDEAAHISDLENQWNTAMSPTLLKTNGRAYFISTPKGKNFFVSLLSKGFDESEAEYNSWQFSTYENPYIPNSEVDKLRDDMTESQFRQEILAIPSENKDGAFSSMDVERNTIDELSTNDPIVFGIDLASRHDYTVIIGLDREGVMCYYDRFRGPWETIYDRLTQLDINVPKIIDNTGVGSPMVQRLQYGIDNVVGFDFSASSKPKVIRELIMDVETDNIKFNRITADEMLVYQYKYSSTGHISYNAQSGFYDDSVCALALANRYRKNLIYEFSIEAV